MEQTVRALRGRIADGIYASHSRLPPQSELCKDFGVSRGVIREAMQQLQSQGLIRMSRGRIATVLPARADALTESLQLLVERSSASWTHLAEVRYSVEVDIAGLAAGRSDPVLWREMEKTLGAMLATDDLSEQVNADMEFHRLLARATGNPIYVFLLDALAALLRASRERTIGNVGVGPAISGHTKILAAVRRRDAAEARAAMIEHLADMKSDLELQLPLQTG